MARIKLVLSCLLTSFIICSCNNPTPSSTSEEIKVKELFVPWSGDSLEGIDVYLGYSTFRIPFMYLGEGIEETINSYKYNEEYISIDKDGVITPLKKGASKVIAYTNTQEVEFRVTVKEYEDYRLNADVDYMKNLYEEKNSPENTNLFIGDSFFDTRYFWKSFYEDFEGKNVFSVGIGTSRIEDLMISKKELIYDINPSKIFIHIGTNNINDKGDTGKITAAKLINLFKEINANLPNCELYYFGIERTTVAAFDSSYAKSTQSNGIVKQYCSENDYITYLDSPAKFEENIFKYLAADGLHPSSYGYEVYKEFVNELI